VLTDGTDNRIRRENPKFGLRWLTWPSNTSLAAIAWRNHPPAEGTPGTVPAAVANLNRVREMKRAARVASRVPAAPSAALAVRTRPEPAPTGGDRPPARRSVRLRRRPSNEGDLDGVEVRVPTTASTVLAWAESWVRLSADEELLSGPLTDDDLARSRCGTSARQLRRLRKAVLSGALRQPSCPARGDAAARIHRRAGDAGHRGCSRGTAGCDGGLRAATTGGRSLALPPIRQSNQHALAGDPQPRSDSPRQSRVPEPADWWRRCSRPVEPGVLGHAAGGGEPGRVAGLG
jgi:hypothetical protein